MAQQGDLTLTFRFDDQGGVEVKRVIRDVEESLQGAGKGAETAGKGFDTMRQSVEKSVSGFGKFKGILQEGTTALRGFGIAWTVFGGFAFAGAKKVDDALDSIRGRTGLTGTALESLTQSFKKVAVTVPQDMGATAQVMIIITQLTGLAGKELEKLATTTLKLSSVMGIDAVSSIESMTKTLVKWNIPMSQAPELMDYLLKVSQKTGTSIGQMTGIMQYSASTIQELGFSFKHSAALIGSLEKAGINTNMVFAMLRITLRQSAKAGEPLSEMFKKLVAEIKNGTNALQTNALAQQYFGRAGMEVKKAIKEGRFEVEEFVKALDSSTESINKAYADTRSFAEIWGELKNKLTIALEPLGKQLLLIGEKYLPKIVAFVEKWSTKFEGMSDAGKSTTAWIVGVGGPMSIWLSLFVKVVENAKKMGGFLIGLAKFIGPTGILVTGTYMAAYNLGKYLDTIPIIHSWAEKWGDSIAKVLGYYKGIEEVDRGIQDMGAREAKNMLFLSTASEIAGRNVTSMHEAVGILKKQFAETGTLGNTVLDEWAKKTDAATKYVEKLAVDVLPKLKEGVAEVSVGVKALGTELGVTWKDALVDKVEKFKQVLNDLPAINAMTKTSQDKLKESYIATLIELEKATTAERVWLALKTGGLKTIKEEANEIVVLQATLVELKDRYDSHKISLTQYTKQYGDATSKLKAFGITVQGLDPTMDSMNQSIAEQEEALRIAIKTHALYEAELAKTPGSEMLKTGLIASAESIDKLNLALGKLSGADKAWAQLRAGGFDLAKQAVTIEELRGQIIVLDAAYDKSRGAIEVYRTKSDELKKTLAELEIAHLPVTEAVRNLMKANLEAATGGKAQEQAIQTYQNTLVALGMRLDAGTISEANWAKSHNETVTALNALKPGMAVYSMNLEAVRQRLDVLSKSDINIKLRQTIADFTALAIASDGTKSGLALLAPTLAGLEEGLKQLGVKKPQEELIKLAQAAYEVQRALMAIGGISLPEIDFSKLIKGIEKAGEGAGNAFVENLQKALPKIGEVLGVLAETITNEFEKDIVDNQTRLNEALKGVAPGTAEFMKLTAELDKANKGITGTQKGLIDLIGGLSSLASVVGTLDLKELFTSGKKGIETFASAIAPALGQIGGAIGELITGSKSKFAALGASVGGTIGSAFGPVGKAVGSLLGGIIGGLFKKAKTEAERLAEQTANQIKEVAAAFSKYGKISDETAKKQVELRKTMTGAAADAMVLADVMKDVGVSLKNINQFWGDAVGAIDQYRQGNLTAAQATEALTNNFTILLSKAVEFGTEGSAAMVNFIKEVQASGLKVKEVTEYIDTQLGTVKTGGISAAQGLELMAIALDGTQASATRLEEQTLAVFNAMIANGASFAEAMNSIGGTLDLLKYQYKELGLKAGEGIERLLKIRDITAAHQELFLAIEGNKAVMDALANTGALTQQTFLNAQSNAVDYFNQLKKAGLTGNEALMQMSPTLERIRYLAKEQGFEIDVATQALINQAEAAGLLKKEQLDTNTVMMAGFGEIIKALGGQIPEAFQKAMSKMKEFGEAGTEAGVAAGRNTVEALKAELETIADREGLEQLAQQMGITIPLKMDFDRAKAMILERLRTIVLPPLVVPVVPETHGLGALSMEEILEKLKLKAREAMEAIVKAATSAELKQEDLNKTWIDAIKIMHDMQMGLLDQKKGMEALETVWGALLSKAVEFGKEGSAGMIAFMRAARAAGLEIKGMTEYVRAQLGVVEQSTMNAAQGLAAMASNIAPRYDELKAKMDDYMVKMKPLMVERAKLLSKLGTTTDPKELSALMIAIAAVDKKLEKFSITAGKTGAALQKAIEQGRKELPGVAAQAVAVFNAMVKSGVPITQAIASLGDSLGILIKKYKDLGVKAPANILELLKIRKVMEAHKELFAAIEGNKAVLEALGNTGFLSQKSFDLAQKSVTSYYEQLKKAGLGGKKSLAQMAPTLERLRYYALEQGLQLDENTKKLIRQAEKQGLLKDVAMDSTDIMMAGFGAIIKALGGEIPEAFKKAMKKAADWGKETEKETKKAIKGFEDVKREISGPITPFGVVIPKREISGPGAIRPQFEISPEDRKLWINGPGGIYKDPKRDPIKAGINTVIELQKGNLISKNQNELIKNGLNNLKDVTKSNLDELRNQSVSHMDMMKTAVANRLDKIIDVLQDTQTKTTNQQTNRASYPITKEFGDGIPRVSIRNQAQREQAPQKNDVHIYMEPIILEKRDKIIVEMVVKKFERGDVTVHPRSVRGKV